MSKSGLGLKTEFDDSGRNAQTKDLDSEDPDSVLVKILDDKISSTNPDSQFGETEFANRFKGRVSLMQKDGHIGVVTRTNLPINKNQQSNSQTSVNFDKSRNFNEMGDNKNQFPTKEFESQNIRY